MYRMKTLGLIAVLALAATAPATAQLDDKLDSAVAQLMAGVAPNQQVKDDCHQQFLAYFHELCRKNNTSTIDGFPPEDAASHYVNALKMSVIDPDRHAGWPYRHDGRKAAFPILKKRLAESNEPVLMAAVIIPALDNGEVQYARDVYRALSARNEFWAHYLLKTIQLQYYSPDSARQFLAGIYQRDPSK